MIIKIQRPIFTNENPPLALIYNKDRSLYFHREFDIVLQILFIDSELKVYHKATLRSGNLIIDRRVKDQDW